MPKIVKITRNMNTSKNSHDVLPRVFPATASCSCRFGKDFNSLSKRIKRKVRSTLKPLPPPSHRVAWSGLVDDSKHTDVDATL